MLSQAASEAYLTTKLTRDLPRVLKLASEKKGAILVRKRELTGIYVIYLLLNTFLGDFAAKELQSSLSKS